MDESVIILSDNDEDQSVIEISVESPGSTCKKTNMENKVESDSDMELEIISQVEKTPRCPISYQKLHTPVKNITCGHIYENSAILYLLSRPKITVYKNIMKCPAAGCSKYVTLKDLEVVRCEQKMGTQDVNKNLLNELEMENPNTKNMKNGQAPQQTPIIISP